MPNTFDPPGGADRRRRRVRAVLITAGVAAVAAVPVLAASNQLQTGATHSHRPSGFQQFTGTANVWPPRMVGATHVDTSPNVRFAAPARARVGALRSWTKTRSAAQARLLRVLGPRFEHVLTTSTIDAKGRVLAGRVSTTYVSYSKNRQVVVTERAGRITRLVSTPFTRAQPGRTRREQTRAVSIARRMLVQRGEQRVTALHGYAILGLPGSKNPFADVRTHFFPTRVLYVSFHRDRLAVPEYTAWVDLSRNLVLRMGSVGR